MGTAHLFFSYAILVGLPFLGVMAVLNLGSRISPTPSIEGKWRLDAELDSNVDTPCADRLSGFVDPVISISQSGVFLDVRLPNISNDQLFGRLEANHFVAEAPPALFGGDVFGLLRVTATLSGARGHQVMHGVIAMPRQIDCVPVPFVAQQVSDQPRRIP